MLRALVGFFLLPRPFLKGLGVCANAGAIAGMVAGLALTFLRVAHGGPVTLDRADVLRVALVLALAGWIVLLVVLVALVRHRLSSVALPALVNAFLVSLLTVLITNALGLYVLAYVIGPLVGLSVGSALCVLSGRLGGQTP